MQLIKGHIKFYRHMYHLSLNSQEEPQSGVHFTDKVCISPHLYDLLPVSKTKAFLQNFINYTER